MNIGDTVQLKGTGFKVEIEGFTSINDQKMIQTKYGDFNVDLIQTPTNKD